jgi:hypothetical protein
MAGELFPIAEDTEQFSQKPFIYAEMVPTLPNSKLMSLGLSLLFVVKDGDVSMSSL